MSLESSSSLIPSQGRRSWALQCIERYIHLVQMLRSFGRASNSSERTAPTPQDRMEPQNHRCRFCVALIERSLNATKT